MAKKIINYRGGFIPRPTAKKMAGIARAAYKSPMVQRAQKDLVNYAGARVLKYITDKVQVSPSGVTATVSRSISGKSIATPTVFGNFGAVTSTKYIEGRGKKYIPPHIKQQGRYIDIRNGISNIEGNVADQSMGTFTTMDASYLNSVSNNMGRLYTSTRNVVNSSNYYVVQATKEIKMTNSSNVGVTVQIYEIVSRVTTDSSISPASSPFAAWDLGLSEGSPAGLTTSQSPITRFTYGSSPFDSDVFTQYYSVKKIFSVELPASTTHVHTSIYNIDREFNPDVIVNGLAGPIKNFTKFTMIVVKGNPVHASTGSDLVSSGPTALDVTTSERIQIYGMPGSTFIAGSSAIMPTIANPQVYTTPTTEQLVVTD